MQYKDFWQSKTFWVNMILFAIAVLTLLQEQPFVPPAVLPWLLFAMGVLNIVLRIWFTDTGISSKRAVQARAEWAARASKQTY